MSHHPYNTQASGNQSSTPGQYGKLSVQAKRGNYREVSWLGPETSFSSSDDSFMTVTNSEDIHFTSTHRDECLSSGISVPLTSEQFSAVERDTSFMEWLPDCKSETQDYSSKFCSSSDSSRHKSSGDPLSEGDCDMLSFPGLGDYDSQVPDKPVAPTRSSNPEYSSEEAANILMRYGLVKEDLELLISYPEDQITPSNLPFILSQIYNCKAKRAATSAQSKPDPEPQPTSSMSGRDRLSSFKEERLYQDKMSPNVQLSKMIDYGHTSKYTVGLGEEIGRSSGSRANNSGTGGMLLMGSYGGSSHKREPLPESTTEVKTSALVSSSSVASLSSVHSCMSPPSIEPTQRLQTQPNQTSQEIISSIALLEDADLRLPKVSEVSRLVLLKEPERDHQLALKTQPSLHVVCGLHSGQRSLVLIGGNNFNQEQSKTQEQDSKEQQKQTQQQLKKETEHHQSWKQPRNAAGKPGPPSSSTHSIIVAPPAPPEPVPSLKSVVCKLLPPSNKQCSASREHSKGLPTRAMMQDYTAATPQIFPHTCSLCLQKCIHMKDWISHQRTSLHLDNRKLFQKRYPEWDGKVLPSPSATGIENKPSPSTSGHTSQHHHQKARHESCSRSRSHSPRRHCSCEGRREKLSSGSRSPHSSRCTRSSPRYKHLTSYSYQSHLRRRRYEKQLSPKRNNERRSSPSRRDEKRLLPSRTLKRQSSTERSSPQQKKLRDVTSPSEQPDLEAVAKTLAPILLAELDKMKAPLTSLSSSAAPSSSSFCAAKELTTKSSKTKPSLQSVAVSSAKPMFVKPLPPTMVKLEGICDAVSYNDVVTAVELFGKTKSVVLFRSKLQAVACFENKEDAEKLRKIKNIIVKGEEVTVLRGKDAVSKKFLLTCTKEQKKPPQQNSTESNISPPETVKSTSIGKVLSLIERPQALPSRTKKKTTGKLVTQTNVLVSKAETVTTKQIAETVKKDNVPVKGCVMEKEALKPEEAKSSKSPEKLPHAGDTKGDTKSNGSETSANGSVVAAVTSTQVDNSTIVNVAEPTKGPETKVLALEAETASPVQVQEPAVVPEDSCEVVQTRGLTSSEMMQQEEFARLNFEAKEAGPVKAGNAETSAVTSVTVNEIMGKCLEKKILSSCWGVKKALSPKLKNKVLLITNLPMYPDDYYTEEDIANLLIPFGFEYVDENIYVIPQKRMAFVLMPSVQDAQNLIRASISHSIVLNCCALCLRPLNHAFPMNPLGFYKSVMKKMNYVSEDGSGSAIIYIKNISPCEASDLKEALKKISSVKNFMRLLNKVFVEFVSIYDADRLGVWYSLLKKGFGHTVYRLNIPVPGGTSEPPKLTVNALPDSKDIAEGATVLTTLFGVPPSSIPPFWVTMTTYPFVFPTVSPWFIIPEYVTVNGVDDIEKAHTRGSEFSTIMLTGLPVESYTHKDIVRLVWHYFRNQNLHTLCHNVIVLPLQRRAFVYFSNWDACCNFVREHIKNPISVGGWVLSIHFVLQDMRPGSSQEIMYRTMMKWSNAHVPESESLENRLLCVEISEITIPLIRMVVDVVASIASFVRFLPLANRIYIEMAECNGVTQVLEKVLSIDYLSTHKIWIKVMFIETLKTLKKRLQDFSELTINLDLDTQFDDIHQPETNKGSKTQSENEGQEDFLDDVSSVQDEQNFNSEDFVVIDEIGNDRADADLHHKSSSSARQISREKRERRSSDVSSATKKTSTRSSKDSKSSASSLSLLPKSTEPTVKSSSSSRVSKTSASSSSLSFESPTSLDWKAKLRKSPGKTSHTSSTAAEDVTVQTHQCHKQTKITESAVPKSDRKVLADGITAQKKTQISSEIQPPAEGQGSEVTRQMQSLEIDFKDDPLRELKKSKVEVEKNGDTVKHLDEEKEMDDGENYQILDSLNDQTDEQMGEDGNKASSTETELPKPEQGHGLLEGGYQVLDSVEDEDKAFPEEHSAMQMELNAFLQVLDSVTEDQAAMVLEDSCLDKDESSTVKQFSEEAVIRENDNYNQSSVEDAVDKNEEFGTTSDQRPRADGDGKDKEEEMLSEESCKASKDAGQIPNNKDQPLEDQDSKDASTDGTEQDAYEILDSIDDQTEIEDDGQKLQTADEQISTVDTEAFEEEDTYQVIDSVEDEPATTGRESEVDNKEKRTKNYNETTKRATKRSGPRTRTCKSKEKEKSPKKQVQTFEIIDTTVKKIADATEEMVYEIVDSVEDESIQAAPTTERSSRRRSARGNKDDKKTSTCTEPPKKPDSGEDFNYEILDCIEAEAASDQPTITTRSTRGSRERVKRDETPKGRRCTPARNLRVHNREETPITKEKAPLKESVPTKKRDSFIRDSQRKAAYEILDLVVDEVVRPIAVDKERRGGPKNDIKKLIKLKDTSSNVAAEEETAYEILYSVKDETVDEQPPNNRSTEESIISKDEEEGKAKKSTLELQPLCKENQSVGSSDPEAFVTVDETGDDEEVKATEEEEENFDNFVTIDELWDFEEEEHETVITRTRGRAKKRTRQAPVRTSARGIKDRAKDERKEEEKLESLPPASLNSSSSLDQVLSALSNDAQTEVQKTKEETVSQSNMDARSAGQQPEPECPDNPTLKGEEEERQSRTSIKAFSKQKNKLAETERKRSRTQSPCVTDDLDLPPFDPKSPLGQEHVVSKLGYFCNICSVFYLNERTAKNVHCRSQRHYDNLQKHHQKHRQRPSGTSTGNSQDSASDCH